MNDDDVVRNVRRKIERERALIHAANAMRQSTNNPAVLSRLDAQNRDGRRNIDYLEGRLRELEMRKMNQGMGSMGLGQEGSPPGQGGTGKSLPPPPRDEQGAYGGQSGGYGDPGPGGYSQTSGGHGLMPPRGPYAPPGPTSGVPKQKANFSKLGMF